MKLVLLIVPGLIESCPTRTHVHVGKQSRLLFRVVTRAPVYAKTTIKMQRRARVELLSERAIAFTRRIAAHKRA